MHELARVTLSNEMDLILAHKRSMKLAEVVGLSLSAQTTFATAVSEVARNTIGSSKSGYLILSIDADQRDKYIVACLKDEQVNGMSRDGLEYAKRLVNKYNVYTQGAETAVELFYHISPLFKIDIYKLDEWRSLFRNEPPISPYEELKRKNEQLQDLSEKIQKSEAQYKTLTNALPLIIFSLDTEGRLLYANEWLTKYSGETIESLNKNRWKSFVHEEDYSPFSLLLKSDIGRGEIAIKLQARLMNKASREYLWHQLSLTPFKDDNGKLQYWIGFIVDIHAQKIVEETLKDNIELKQIQAQLEESQRSQQRYIEELNRSNQELQQFAFVASHDLQEPVRKLLYYSDYLVNQYAASIENKGMEYLLKMRNSANRMRTLIKDLLVFSQIKREEIKFAAVDLNKVADHARQDFEIAIKEKNAVLTIEELPVIEGDERMMVQLFENIISNSLKYARKNAPPEIHIRHSANGNSIELSFKDNGIGFNEKYLSQMFTLFQRLHNQREFEGTGLGLAICRKITDAHNGKIWAESKEGDGATFFVSLPARVTANN
ncbi:MAG: PAS domain S-box protein [Williamsia sp.]|nr:PAS domain S-box protein [Williamsia sp.]